jgi:hypothetical protein
MQADRRVTKPRRSFSVSYERKLFSSSLYQLLVLVEEESDLLR